jgi:hypothetical protein
MEEFAAFDVLKLQPDGSERWVDCADSFSAALFQAELSGIAMPGKYVIRNHRNGEQVVICLDIAAYRWRPEHNAA